MAAWRAGIHPTKFWWPLMSLSSEHRLWTIRRGISSCCGQARHSARTAPVLDGRCRWRRLFSCQNADDTRLLVAEKLKLETWWCECSAMGPPKPGPSICSAISPIFCLPSILLFLVRLLMLGVSFFGTFRELWFFILCDMVWY